MMRMIAALAMMIGMTSAFAREELPNVEFDRSAEGIKRGAVVVTTVCMGCHGLRYLKYRDLLTVGFTQSEIDKVRGTQAMDDAMQSATPDDLAVELFGLVPPDQSTLAKAREGGARYIYALLTSYAKDEKGEVVNHWLPGVRMPDVLDYATANDAQRVQLQQQVRDAAVFLEWASDPRAGARKRLGYSVLAYFVLLTFLLYLVKRRVWARLPPPTSPFS